MPSVLRYQRATRSMPSGLSDGTRMKIVLSRMARNFGLFSVITRQANWTAVCVAAISVAWMEQVIMTTALPCAANCAAFGFRGEPRIGQAPLDFAIARQGPQRFRRSDQGGDERTPLGRAPVLFDAHAVARFFERTEVGDHPVPNRGRCGRRRSGVRNATRAWAAPRRPARPRTPRRARSARVSCAVPGQFGPQAPCTSAENAPAPCFRRLRTACNGRSPTASTA